MKNKYKHNADGTTTIFITYLDEEFEVMISTSKFDVVNSIGRKWRMWWSSGSRTYYVACTNCGKTMYLHRLVTDCPKGLHVHHIDGNGLNNTNNNLEILTPKEHSEITKKKSKGPYIGDPSLGVELHLLSEFAENGKRPFRLKINGIQFSTIRDDLEGHLRKAIAYFIMCNNHTDEQIYDIVSRVGSSYRDKSMIAKHINWVRKFTRIPDPSGVKSGRNIKNEFGESIQKETQAELPSPMEI